MNVVDLILVAILACVTLHFYFRKKKKALSSGKEKEKPIREAVRKEGQERACPVICVVFQPELEEEELAAEIADMYLHGRAYYYSGKPLPEQPKEEPISIKYKDVQPKLSKTYRADMFLSLHMNSASNRTANGTEVYYSSRNNKVTSTGLYSKKMASIMLNSVLNGINSKNRGVRQAGFVVNKYNTVPSVLVELGFITGNKDYPNLKKASYREKAAKALYDGVEKIFKKYPAK